MDFRIKPKDDVDKAYAEGTKARENDAGLDSNPYLKGEKREAWEDGWYDQDAES